MRLTPSIGKMTPEQIMRKMPFSVPIPEQNIADKNILMPGTVYVPPINNDVRRDVKTQADFLREFYPSSHKINSLKYYPNTFYMNQQTGAYQAKIRSRIAVGFQQYIHLQRKEALLGNNVGMRLVAEATNQRMIDTLAFFREGWEDKDMEVAVNNSIDADFEIADVAVYIYMDNKKTRWRVFSYADGDTLAELKAGGLELHAVLADNDAYHALQAVGGLLITGPTGTNVNDVAVGLIGE